MRNSSGWRNSALAGCLLLVCIAQTGCVSPWSKKNRVDTLMITGNYSKSRLLAELAQHETKQPIILIDPKASGTPQLFFMPSTPEAMAFDNGKYKEFVEFLQPARIVFLGDTSFVPQRYIDEVRASYPTVVINSEDWRKNAKALATVLKYKKLPKLYAGYLDKLEAAAGGKAVSAGDLATPAGPPEPALSPQLVPPAVEPAR